MYFQIPGFETLQSVLKRWSPGFSRLFSKKFTCPFQEIAYLHTHTLDVLTHSIVTKKNKAEQDQNVLIYIPLHLVANIYNQWENHIGSPTIYVHIWKRILKSELYMCHWRAIFLQCIFDHALLLRIRIISFSESGIFRLHIFIPMNFY